MQLRRHCTVQFNASTLFVFGGVGTFGKNGTNYHKVLHESYPGTPIYDGFFLNVPNPDDVNSFVTSYFPDDNQFPCKGVNSRLSVNCALRLNHKGQK